jgi:propanediol utilization protein
MSVDEAIVERVSARVAAVLSHPPIEIEASGRHVHLTQDAVAALFGKGYTLTRAADLSQPGQYSCKERVRLVGPKGEFPSVVVLGPPRKDIQVEVSLSDAVTLGIKAPVRLSGQTEDSPGATLIGPAGTLNIERGVIAAWRHIHITPEDARVYGITDGDPVSVTVFGERGMTLKNVIVRVSGEFRKFMHIDYDEANACGFHKGMAGFIEGA